MAFLGPDGLSIIERCPYYGGDREERLDCSLQSVSYTDQSSFTSMHVYMYYINLGGTHYFLITRKYGRLRVEQEMNAYNVYVYFFII